MIFKSFPLTLLLALLISSALSYDFQYEKDTNIMILSQIDFPQAIQQYPYLLVNFYARWCKYSKKLAPEYLKLSETLKKDNSEVKIAKVEAYDEKALAQEYDIEGFPTIKIFISGVPHEYYGDKTASHILEFINRKQKKPLSKVSDLQSLDNFLKEYEWVALIIGEDNNAGVLEAASKLQDVLFVSSTSDAIKKKYGDITDGEFVLVNNVTKGYKVGIEDLNTENILNFIKANRFSATIPRFGRGTAEHIMSSEEPAMILIKDNSQASKTAEEAFISASQDLSGKIFMTIADYQEEIGQLLAKSLGVKQEELPAVRILRADREKIRKYYLEGGITKSSLVKFQEDYAKKKAPRVYLSEPVPKENNDLTKKVVLDTFKEMVLDSQKDVLVVFWAPWSTHCRSMMPTIDNVARKTQNIKDFEVVKVDATANDVEKYGIDIVEYPTILLFTRGDKKNPIEFRGERNEYVFNDFIRAYATVNLEKLKKPDPWTLSEL